MYTIGEFAGHGRVSVRMLRHYDAIGLLTPARVDASTGYRYYDLGQLPELLRITDLRALGCGLDEIRRALSDEIALRGVLEHRETELEASLAAGSEQLARVRERLHRLERNIDMSADIVYKDVAPVRVYVASATAEGMGPEVIGPIVGPLFDRVHDTLEAAGADFTEPGIAIYEGMSAGESVTVHAAMTAGPDAQPVAGLELRELPPLDGAATFVHHGAMARIGDSWMSLIEGITADGKRLADESREVYLVSPRDSDQTDWVTELQQAVDG